MNFDEIVESSISSLEEHPIEIKFVGPENYRVKLYIRDDVYYLWAGSYHHRMLDTQYDIAFTNEEVMLKTLKKFIDTREVEEISNY